MSELKVIDVDNMADVRSLRGQFYRKSEVDEVISTIKSERDANSKHHQGRATCREFHGG